MVQYGNKMVQGCHGNKVVTQWYTIYLILATCIILVRRGDSWYLPSVFPAVIVATICILSIVTHSKLSSQNPVEIQLQIHRGVYDHFRKKNNNRKVTCSFIWDNCTIIFCSGMSLLYYIFTVEFAGGNIELQLTIKIGQSI